MVFITHEQRDRRAEGHTMLDSRLKVDNVLFVALWNYVCRFQRLRCQNETYRSGQVALTRPTTA